MSPADYDFAWKFLYVIFSLAGNLQFPKGAFCDVPAALLRGTGTRIQNFSKTFCSYVAGEWYVLLSAIQNQDNPYTKIIFVYLSLFMVTGDTGR